MPKNEKPLTAADLIEQPKKLPPDTLRREGDSTLTRPGLTGVYPSVAPRSHFEDGERVWVRRCALIGGSWVTVMRPATYRNLGNTPFISLIDAGGVEVAFEVNGVDIEPYTILDELAGLAEVE